MGRTEDAKRAAAKAQISNIDSALQLYKLDNGNIPTTEQGLKALVERPASGPAAPNWKAGGYLPKVPVDPGALHTSTRLRLHREASSRSFPSGPTGSREVKGKTPTS
jgi:type II secretion system protein G